MNLTFGAETIRSWGWPHRVQSIWPLASGRRILNRYGPSGPLTASSGGGHVCCARTPRAGIPVGVPRETKR